MEDADFLCSTSADRLAEAIDLDRAGNALEMRQARLLARLRRMDLAPLGYGSFRSFCAAVVEGCDTQVRQLIALVESPFAKIRTAVVAGRLAPSVAIRGVRVIGREEEDAWLEDALAGSFSRVRRAPPLEREFTGEDVIAIHAARTLARTNLGREVSDAVADRHILTTWKAQEPREKLRQRALASPPPPAPLSEWSGPDPADALVGPWQEPEDADHAVALLRLVTAMRRDRIRQLGIALDQIVHGRDYQAEGFRSFEAWARKCLSIDVRTVQRYRRALEEHPDLDLDRALFLADVATDDTRAEWRAIVPRVPAAELGRVRVLARQGAEDVLRRAYTAAIAVVDARADARVDVSADAQVDVSAVGTTDAPGADPTNTAKRRLGAMFDTPPDASTDTPPDAPGSQATNTANRRFVSLAATLPPPPAPRATVAHPDLPEAARWYLVHGKAPRQRGIGWVKERDVYTCTNPECACRTQRIHVHHRVFREHGGTDEGENLHSHCKPCHLRLIHSGHLAVERKGELLVFTFRDREITMFGHAAF